MQVQLTICFFITWNLCELYGQHENKTSQESLYAQLRHDWVARFATLPPEYRPRAKSGVSSVTASSLPMDFKSQELVEQGV